ncbi:MAG: tyrosine-type recombinase/integrase [Gemmatimonadota bacterium]|nr:tyrosine-type recombinase/integrase [Deltaproteobacteria bacterium]MDE2973680.1 tyrosine-type recombinase/integrase [Gemmatimonadota bacterium]
MRRAGPAACFAADEFFSARISNPETRRAYARAVGWFLEFCEREDVELARVTPGLAGRFIRSLPVAPATKNQALAAMRNFFGTLVERHVVLLNPFQSVRGIKHNPLDGKTPELTVSQARMLLASFDLSTHVGRRDRALFGTMITTGCRVGALARLRVGDLSDTSHGRVFRFREKNGKERDIPVRSDLDGWLEEYMQADVFTSAPPDSPLWLYGNRWGALKSRALRPPGIRALLKRRLKAAGLPANLTPHSFRVMVVTALLEQAVPVEEVQRLVGHSHPSTTQLYDRRTRRITRSIVERIPV